MNNELNIFSANRVYLIASILSATITATGGFLALNWVNIFGSEDQLEQNDQMERSEIVDQQVQNDSMNVQGAFGRWMDEVVKDVPHLALSDGFVAAYSGSNNPADEFVIEVGEIDDEGRVHWHVRTRAGRYDGTVSPVAKGDYWRVRSFDDGSITVSWLPISYP